jgi:GT2 family glycosyltransferase
VNDVRLPYISIIVPCKAIGDYARECVAHCLQLDYPSFEILLLPDDEGEEISGVRTIATGPVGPSAKRDAASKYATGEVLAFIDDDAFPRSDWLTNAARHFTRPEIAGVGGPAITPPSDSMWLQASGAVYQSLLGGGPYSYRYVPRPPRNVDDYPTCNLLVRKTVFDNAGGFGTEFWPGEDTKLCLTITKQLGFLIIYDPEVAVWHHRRPLFSGHMKQVASYALHRGFFVRKFPATSRRVSYFLPSLLLCGLLAGGLILLVPTLRSVYLAAWLVYFLAVTVSTLMVSNHQKRLFFPVMMGTIVTHFVYGYWFIKGLLSRRLRR